VTRMIFGKVMWVGRATVFLIGFAVMLALVFGAASAAFGADTDFFRLGRSNFAESITRLIKSGGGPALSLQVDSGPPLVVNADAETAKNLSADEFDGKNSNKFVQNSGKITFSVFDSWISSHSSSNQITVDHRGYWTTFTRGAGEQTQSEVRLAPPLPSSLYGKSMLLTGMEICYNTSDAAVALSRVKLLRYSSTGVLPTGGNFVVDDSTPADGNQCRMYSGTPQLMGTNSFAFLEMHVNWSETTSQTSFVIERTTFFLKPSNAPAAPL
jgi:hypothetical protein